MFDFLPHVSLLTPADLDLAESSFSEQIFRKNQTIVRNGFVCRYLYFIRRGLVYAQTPDEKIIYYEFEGNSCTDIESFIQGIPAQISIVSAEEGTEVYSISRSDFVNLTRISHSWAVWAVKFWEQELVRVAGYYEAMRNKDASQRYQDLVA
ncbi:MAG: Crp/Fnr family transcriptional regulator, partial [Bacteroidota bacterium]